MKIAKALTLTGAILLLIATAGSAEQFTSPRVSGNFVYQNGMPANDRQLHFQNRASGDMYVAATDEHGDFSASLPPGIYDLRAERGVVLKKKILVTDSDFNIGRVVELAPLDVRRPFEHQGIAEAVLKSPAPATANMLGRPMMGLTHGHTLMQQMFGGPAKPLPPIPSAIPALPTPAPSPAATQ